MKQQPSVGVRRDFPTLRVGPVGWLSGRRKPEQRPQRFTLEELRQDMIVRRILLPTDFSSASAKAAQRAVALGKHYKASITILHVINVLTPCCTGSAAGLMRHFRAAASENMRQFASLVAEVPNVQTLITEGLPWEEIVCESENFDLLIIAKDGRQKAWACFSQHTLQRVIQQANCPVLTIPKHASEQLSVPVNHPTESLPHPVAAA